MTVTQNLELFPAIEISNEDARTSQFFEHVKQFKDFGTETQTYILQVGNHPVPVFVNEFWTSKQRTAHSIHEVSYRACFKPQLPRFFIQKLTNPGDTVLDPFMGRGTTLIEAVLENRQAVGCDINPLSKIMCGPRLSPPELEQIAKRLKEIDISYQGNWPSDLAVFFHPDTLRELCSLRNYLAEKANKSDRIDRWIQMVATNRLTGHSKGFFSVYTLPPNQAVTADRQRIINEKRGQEPEYRDVKTLILKKSKSLLRDISKQDKEAQAKFGVQSKIVIGASNEIKGLRPGSVGLVVTSPPFLDVVDYANDNWLRCWFNDIDPQNIPISIHRKLDDWRQDMFQTFKHINRLLQSGGYVAFEVGEVRGGTIQLEDHVIPAAEEAGFTPILVLVNDQAFTKTSHCWGVSNLEKGTNTNRIVLLKKP